MCWRSVGSVCVTFLFVFGAWTAEAQELPPAVAALIEQLAEDGGDIEAMGEYYEGLLLRPLNVNAVTQKQLEELRLLTLFQIASLLEWRQRYGAIRSASELALIEGFSPEEAARLRPFISFGEPAAVRRLANTFTFRAKKKWKQEGFSLTAKEQFTAGDLAVHATIDNDPGEKFPDFISLSARWKGFFAGDFTARFGQGLVLWKSFSLTAFGTPSSVARSANDLREYRSTDESNFFRGAGWTGRFGRLQTSVFASYNAVDARIVDGAYTSVATDGLHATESERAKHHTMHEPVFGANVSLELERWHFGVTAAAYRYDKPNGRKVQEYNKYQQYDGWWGNLGADFCGSIGSLRIFGEAAVDAHLAPAVTAGILWSPSYNFETSLSARCYAPAYIATHAGAYSTLSSVSNQVGATGALQWIKGRWTLRLNADYAWYPWKRYRAEAGTSGVKARLQAVRDFRSGAQFEAQLAWSSRLKARLRYSQPIGGSWTLSSRIDANPGGIGAYVDVRWSPSRKWDVSARVTAWATRDWDSRLSFYERNVPQSFAVENYSGKGIGAYLVVKYAPIRQIEIWAKVQQGYCAYFVRIFIPG